VPKRSALLLVVELVVVLAVTVLLVAEVFPVLAVLVFVVVVIGSFQVPLLEINGANPKNTCGSTL
jgi:hypothetical protein